MAIFFECGLSYEKTIENGTQKKVTEPYLVDALSFTEAEANIIREIKPFIAGEFTIRTIKRARISEVFFNEDNPDADKYFKAKINFISLDVKKGKESKTAAYMLAKASDIDEAKKVVVKGMQGTMSDYEIESLSETKIMDIFLCKPENDSQS